jgi:hypothetical protein
MLAYVFWHVPRPGIAPADYEPRLAAFHAALRAGEVPGVGRTTTLGLAAIPWLDGAAGYEDWYLVEDFAALGTLNAAAVAGARQAPHDAAAAAALTGVAGVMGHVCGPQLPAEPGWAAWLGKPAGLAYDDFHAQLATTLAGVPEACAWQRQMTLGPATEYCVLAAAAAPLPWPAQSWPVRTVT